MDKNRKRVFFMKYDLNFKLDCVRKYKERKRDFVPLGICRRTFLSHVGSWVNLVNFRYLNLDNDNLAIFAYFFVSKQIVSTCAECGNMSTGTTSLTSYLSSK